MRTDRLTPKQRRFVDEYLIDLNASKAAIRAGYSAKSAEDIGRQLLRKTPVAAAIEAAMAERAVRTQVDADRVLRELAAVGLSDIRNLFGDDGRLKKPSDLDPSTAASIASMKIVTRSIGEGEVEYVQEVKFWDKNSALVTIARHLGMLNDKLTVKGDAENPLVMLLQRVQGSTIQPVPSHMLECEEV